MFDLQRGFTDTSFSSCLAQPHLKSWIHCYSALGKSEASSVNPLWRPQKNCNKKKTKLLYDFH